MVYHCFYAEVVCLQTDTPQTSNNNCSQARKVDQRRHTSYIARDWNADSVVTSRESSREGVEANQRGRSRSPGQRNESVTKRSMSTHLDHQVRSHSSHLRSRSFSRENVEEHESKTTQLNADLTIKEKQKQRIIDTPEKHNPNTYKSIRSMKHKDKAYQEGLRKSSSLTDLASASDRHTDFEENLYRSRSRDNLTDYPQRQRVSSHSECSFESFPRPMTLFESLRHSLLNPDSEKTKHDSEKTKPKNNSYLHLAGIPQTRPIEDYVGASPVPNPPIRRKSADLGQGGGRWQSRVGRSRSAGRSPRDKSPEEDPLSLLHRRSRDTWSVNPHATRLAVRSDKKLVKNAPAAHHQGLFSTDTASSPSGAPPPPWPGRSKHYTSSTSLSSLSNSHLRKSSANNPGTPRQDKKNHAYSSGDSGFHSESIGAIPGHGRGEASLYDGRPSFLYTGKNKNETDEHKVSRIQLLF